MSALALSPSEAVFAWLREQADREIETSCARVFLLPGRALKLKKPVDFGFLDFSTPRKRLWALDRELAFNRRTSPDIYRRLAAITREGSGFAFDGPGEVVDYALEMRRFDPDAVLCEHPDRLTGELAEALGRMIARFHADAPVRRDGGGVKALGYTIRTNAEHLRTLADRLGGEAVDRVIAATDAAFADASPLLEARRSSGFARHCHGDLHLGNILLEEGEPRLFDCIEFNDLLSEIDVLYDVAFLLMDLDIRDRPQIASRVMNAYLDEALRGFPEAFLDGLAALPLMLSARAAVRAHVTAYQGEIESGRTYLAAAERHLRPAPATLTAIGGVSGTGKTTLARLVAPDLASAPGAVILRSDEARKRGPGQAHDAPAPPRAYDPAAVRNVYAALFREARRILDAGRSVILDATFLDADLRASAAAVAKGAGVAFHGVWLTAPRPLLEQRLFARAGDASDATVATLRLQLTRDPGQIDWTLADASDLSGAAKALSGRETQP
ncbi:MAG: AAA family ATPase [Caulobacterales bacterium]